MENELKNKDVEQVIGGGKDISKGKNENTRRIKRTLGKNIYEER